MTMTTETITVKRGDDEWALYVPCPETLREYVEVFGEAETLAMANESRGKAYYAYLAKRMKKDSSDEAAEEANACIVDMEWYPFCEINAATKQLALDVYALTDQQKLSFGEEIRSMTARDTPPEPPASSQPAAPFIPTTPAPPMDVVPGYSDIDPAEKAAMVGQMPAQMPTGPVHPTQANANPQALASNKVLASQTPPRRQAADGPGPVLRTNASGTPIGNVANAGPQAPLTTPIPSPPIQDAIAAAPTQPPLPPPPPPPVTNLP